MTDRLKFALAEAEKLSPAAQDVLAATMMREMTKGASPDVDPRFDPVLEEMITRAEQQLATAKEQAAPASDKE